jgi:hypothetical protein
MSKLNSKGVHLNIDETLKQEQQVAAVLQLKIKMVRASSIWLPHHTGNELR